MAHRPSSIPLPVAAAPVADNQIPPTPSAFPSLSGDGSGPALAPPLPASTLHYAQVTGKVLPPSSIPKGISLPPPPHPPTTSTNSTSRERERIQSSGQKNRDSPYARPGAGPRTISGGQQQRERERRKSKPSTAPPAAQDKPDSQQENKRRSIPGMPPAWVAKNSKTAPAAVQKGSHARRKSEGSPTFALAKAKDKEVHPPANGPGKKKRQTLSKTLDPAHSKLSALAPSFEFVPRSATSPNLAAYAQASSSESGSEEERSDDRAGGNDSESTSPEASTSSSLGSYLASSFSLSTPSSLASLEDASSIPESDKKDPAEGLVDEKLAAEIVSSSGPQADGFVGQSLTQSESGARPDADKTGFRAISGVVNESPLADLEWKEKMGWWREDYDPKVPQVEEGETAPEGNVEEEEQEAEVKLAPAAVEANSHETPLLQFPPWTPSPSTSNPAENEDASESSSSVSPAILAEVLGSSFSDPPVSAEAEEPSSSPVASSSQPSPPPLSDDVEKIAPAPATPSLSSFLPTSFTPPLSGYPSTSDSFDSSFLSQDELRAEKLAQDGPSEAQGDAQAEEMPLSAEAVASQPTLDDALDVKQVPSTSSAEVASKDGGVTQPREVRKGWWNQEDDENETAKPQPGQAEHSDAMVDPQLAKETVESAGAQADGFVAKGFEEVDRVGEEAQEGEKEVKKEVEGAAAAEESHREVADEVEAKADDVEPEVEQPEGSSTPLGSFLSSAFQPAETTFSSTAEETSTPGGTTTSSAEKDASSADDSASQNTPPVSTPSPAAPVRRSSSPPPPERRPSESHAADSAPSLTLAISSAWHTAPWSRKIWAIIASVAINVGLPFVNGVMLGFGELFARNVLGVRFGWPLHNNTSTTANTGGVGLRSAGAYNTSNANGGRGVGTDVPGHAGAKTTLEGVVESVVE
ncbi:hypothetical protein JCM11491_004813 [Sporobolomyces phaffii]